MSARPSGVAREAGREGVVLVHGLWTNRFVMSYLARHLARSGFKIHSLTYRSVRKELDENAETLARVIEAAPEERLHIVGHSLGGVVTLASLARHAPERVARVVLLASPVSGCEVGRRLSAHRLMQPFLGATAPLWRELRPPVVDPRYEIGTLAGTVPFGLGRLVAPVEGANDGVVRVEEARYAGARDHIELSLAHSQVLVSPEAARQVVVFLKTGRFAR